MPIQYTMLCPLVNPEQNFREGGINGAPIMRHSKVTSGILNSDVDGQARDRVTSYISI